MQPLIPTENGTRDPADYFPSASSLSSRQIRFFGDKLPERKFTDLFDVRSIHVQDLQKAGQIKSFAEKIAYVDALDGSVTILHCLG